jgi:hypothetical protein
MGQRGKIVSPYDCETMPMRAELGGNRSGLPDGHPHPPALGCARRVPRPGRWHAACALSDSFLPGSCGPNCPIEHRCAGRYDVAQ